MGRMELFKKKIENEYFAYLKELDMFERHELIEMAYEIAAAQKVYQYVIRENWISEDDADELLKLKTTLRGISEAFADWDNLSRDAFDECVYEIIDKQIMFE